MIKIKPTQADYDRLNPPIFDHILGDDGRIYQELLDDDRWLNVGYIPTPTTRLGWFVYHVVHGLAMRYPVASVLRYAWQNSNANGVSKGLNNGCID